MIEPEPVPISALEHWSYCPRQCGLIHLEQTFSDNVFTIRGSNAHERVHAAGLATGAGTRVARNLPLFSDALGLVGRADLVEFRGSHPYPVEYKVGRKRRWGHDDLQLAAQAMCLEEMLGVGVPRGAMFHYGSQARREVRIDENLRELVRVAAEGIRSMLAGERLPEAVNDARCPSCSLVETCLPSVVTGPRRVRLLR